MWKKCPCRGAACFDSTVKTCWPTVKQVNPPHQDPPLPAPPTSLPGFAGKGKSSQKGLNKKSSYTGRRAWPTHSSHSRPSCNSSQSRKHQNPRDSPHVPAPSSLAHAKCYFFRSRDAQSIRPEEGFDIAESRNRSGRDATCSYRKWFCTKDTCPPISTRSAWLQGYLAHKTPPTS